MLPTRIRLRWAEVGENVPNGGSASRSRLVLLKPGVLGAGRAEETNIGARRRPTGPRLAAMRRLAKRLGPRTILAHQHKRGRRMADKPATQDNDLVLKAMIAVAASDGGLDARETGLIQEVYRNQSGQTLSADEVAQAAEALAKCDLAEFAAAAKTLDNGVKEEVIKCAYRVLLADNRIAGEERKKLKDIAAALRVSEIHFCAILEDLADELAQQG